MAMMRPYFIGLQFLTRLHFVTQTEWTAEDFGRSVKFFPAIGATLGLCYAAVIYLLLFFLPLELNAVMPLHFLAAVLVIMPILLTGGLHCDGYMDTADGLFSGRDREKMLAIMKDSRVGSNGVFAFVILMLLEFATVLDLLQGSNYNLLYAFFVMPIVGRTMMSFAIVIYPYARPEGIGKAFKQFADAKTLSVAGLTAAIALLPFGVPAIVSLIVALIFMNMFAKFAVKMLGGLTGDIYGAITTICEVLTLLVFLLFQMNQP